MCPMTQKFHSYVYPIEIKCLFPLKDAHQNVHNNNKNEHKKRVKKKKVTKDKNKEQDFKKEEKKKGMSITALFNDPNLKQVK